MADLKYQPVAHNHASFLAKARLRPGFVKAYDELAMEYAQAHEMPSARARAALTHAAGREWARRRASARAG